MQFWDPLGGKLSFSLLTFANAKVHPKFLLFGGLILVLFFATDPSSNRAYVPLWASAAIWPIAYVIYMTLFASALVIQSIVTGWVPTLRVPTPVIGFFALFPTVYASEVIILDIMSGGTYPEKLAGNYLFYFLSVQVCEAVFFKFIFPALRVEVQTNAGQTDTANFEDTRHVIIGGERIPLGDIRLIEARQHHVHVTLSDSERRLRARMGDFVAQTSPSDGVQTHRSWWVARHAAKEISEENGRPVLRLEDDIPVPIARTRVNDVLSWATEHLDSGTQIKPAAE